jgi:hypothetical protein
MCLHCANFESCTYAAVLEHLEFEGKSAQASSHLMVRLDVGLSWDDVGHLPKTTSNMCHVTKTGLDGYGLDGYMNLFYKVTINTELQIARKLQTSCPRMHFVI